MGTTRHSQCNCADDTMFAYLTSHVSTERNAVCIIRLYGPIYGRMNAYYECRWMWKEMVVNSAIFGRKEKTTRNLVTVIGQGFDTDASKKGVRKCRAGRWLHCGQTQTGSDRRYLPKELLCSVAERDSHLSLWPGWWGGL